MSDYRDAVITELADSEAELRATVLGLLDVIIDLTLKGYHWQAVAEQFSQERVDLQREVQQLRASREAQQALEDATK